MPDDEKPKGGQDPPRSRDGIAQGEGRYRIAAVAELTGVPEPTLRAWERRYGIPVPSRTASGYRLYSDEDVRQVHELRRLSESGIAAAEAAQIVIGAAPVVARRRQGARGDGQVDPFARAVDSILSSVERFDGKALEEVLRKLPFLGSATDVLEWVLSPALVTIGDRWHAGKFSVAQEHFATFKLGTVMRDIFQLMPRGDGADAVVLASFADDEHELGLLGVAIHMTQWGLSPLFLGARTPPSAIRDAVGAVSPRLVALSTTVTPPRPRARELVDDYAAACGRVPWGVGGAGVAEIADLVSARGGLLLPDDTTDLRAAIQPLLSSALPHRTKRGSR